MTTDQARQRLTNATADLNTYREQVTAAEAEWRSILLDCFDAGLTQQACADCIGLSKGRVTQLLAEERERRARLELATEPVQ